MSDCEVIQVIHTTLLRRGRGIESDPIRCIDQYWTLDGQLLWEVDPCPEARTIEQDEADQMTRVGVGGLEGITNGT